MSLKNEYQLILNFTWFRKVIWLCVHVMTDLNMDKSIYLLTKWHHKRRNHWHHWGHSCRQACQSRGRHARERHGGRRGCRGLSKCGGHRGSWRGGLWWCLCTWCRHKIWNRDYSTSTVNPVIIDTYRETWFGIRFIYHAHACTDIKKIILYTILNKKTFYTNYGNK